MVLRTGNRYAVDKQRRPGISIDVVAAAIVRSPGVAGNCPSTSNSEQADESTAVASLSSAPCGLEEVISSIKVFLNNLFGHSRELTLPRALLGPGVRLCTPLPTDDSDCTSQMFELRRSTGALCRVRRCEVGEPGLLAAVDAEPGTQG